MRIKADIRRIIARILIFCIVLGGFPAKGEMVVYASTEIDNNRIANGHNDNTIWAEKDNGAKFDLVGIKKSGVYNYEQDNSRVLQTVYGFKGYHTYINDSTLEEGKITYIPNQGRYNGGVMEFPDTHEKFPNMEVSVKTDSSPDGQYVFVDYYIYNKNLTTKTMYIGTTADVQIGDDDGADLARTFGSREGFYMVNGKDGTDAMATFECITNDPELRIYGDEWGVKRWIGAYSTTYQCNHLITQPDEFQSVYQNRGYEHYVFKENKSEFNSTKDIKANALNNPNRYVDSAFAYSWKVDVRPYEVAHRRVAYTVRPTSYYVSSQRGENSSSRDGSFAEPFSTIDYAMSKLQGKRGYIYIMDYAPIQDPIQVPNAAGTDITVLSSNFDENGSTISENVGLKRASEPRGPMFIINSNQVKLGFNNITLDGNGVESSYPLINAVSGELQINSGAALTGNKVTDSTTASAINVTGSASLRMNSGTISNNTSAGAGAVYFDSSGKFTAINQIQIADNVNQAGEKANVILAEGKYITVEGDLGSSLIGVTTRQVPAASVGETTEQSQEVVIAVPSANYPGSISACPFADNFFADGDTGNMSGIFATVGSSVLNNNNHTVLKRNGYTISFITRDASTGGTVNGSTEIVPKSFGGGQEVLISKPSEIPGYELTGIEIEQGDETLLVPVEEENEYGSITGFMPAQDVVVTYEYTRVEASIAFVVNGGTPQQETLTGTAGTSVNALLPTVSRYGYIFRGWSKVNSQTEPQIITALPSVFQEEPITYYAIWEADPAVKFHYTVSYTNQNGSIVFQSGTTEHAYSVEAQIQSQKKNIHGYIWSLEDSSTSPAEYDYNGLGAEPVGTFHGGTGSFEGRMPGQDAAVRFGYKVDRSNPHARSDLNVQYITESQTVVHAPNTTSYFPEDEITASPVDVYGYRLVSAEITGGNESDSTDGHLVSAVQGTFDSNSRFTGIMPNQPVEITYIYEATEEGYNFAVNYKDNGTTDNRLRNVLAPDIQKKKADVQVRADYQELYGYSLERAAAVPNGQGSFDGASNFTGTMPNNDLSVFYYYDRVSEKWVQITYHAGLNGTITVGNDTSSDVQSGGNETYKTRVLKNDGSLQGQADSYTWSEVKEKHLVPEPQADSYYRFAGWFVDSNQNGKLDNGEEILAEDYRFTEDTAVTALFEEDPEKWIDISFAAGEHGALLESAAQSLHVKYDMKWEDISDQRPAYIPEANYLPDGWYDGDAEVEDHDVLKNGHTYTIHFYPDPGVFGTDVAPPDAMAGLNGEGKGKVVIYNTSPGYQYIITDLDGNILLVERGSISGRVYFDSLYPGARYLVYEAAGNVQASPENKISEIEGVISDPVEVLTPVVDTNYQILYDETHDGKTELVIKPADKKSDYAVLDKDGQVVMTPETEESGWQSVKGNPGTISFSGLNYDEEYIVVARPKGVEEITPESRRPDGSAIVTDPGGALDIPQYIIETIYGTVTSVDGQQIGTERYEEAHKGDQVVLTAREYNDADEQFDYWKITIGTVPGFGGKIRTRELAFEMPDTNLVFTAYYSRPAATPSNAAVVDEVRGGRGDEIALNPDEVSGLEEVLTTEKDRTLLDENHADVTYKVVYTKNKVKATESNAVKSSASYDNSHSQAYKGAFGLNVDIERYVNGRKTEIATPSQAQFSTYVQLDKEDVDMMDYQLYRIVTDPDDGSMQAEPVSMSDNPEETGGLFTFYAEAGSRYVFVYSKAYRLYFLNQTVLPKYQYYFKVRKGEAAGDGYYSSEYAQVEEPADIYISEDGIEYNFEDWSYRDDKLKAFDPDNKINRKTYVYAYYKDNHKEVNKGRNELEEEVKKAIDMSDDHFLTRKETEKLKRAIEDALDILDRTAPKATAEELTDAIHQLTGVTRPLEKILDKRYNHYEVIQDSGNKGGSSRGGGGSGKGTSVKPHNPTLEKHYTVGTNGNWEKLEGADDRWSFVLNGGIRLTGMWAKLDYKTGDLNQNGWYHFNDNGIMDYGWFRDEKLNWYYCNTKADGLLGKMKTGWYHSVEDNRWYYLDPDTGIMAKGWRNIDGVWYYFTAQNSMETYGYDLATGKWVFKNNTEKPLGSMYVNEKTPDGYHVNTDGALMQ
ncbi:hypothetical protein [Clostridium sp. HBUAS56010]|uniref:hypothetical protein n=1 Tax=Clostridium sp. HBUAS56010 TaxID=2571127 RepID=UPI001177B312|nr:hypothetical protein [Clostridium sp. HBUAS56010]